MILYLVLALIVLVCSYGLIRQYMNWRLRAVMESRFGPRFYSEHVSTFPRRKR